MAVAPRFVIIRHKYYEGLNLANQKNWKLVIFDRKLQESCRQISEHCILI